ncbi:MAG: thioredoxin family protein [Chthoniobacterales bacterium]
MKPIILMMSLVAVAMGNMNAAPEIGKAAPDFTAVDSTGKSHKLSDFKGKFVVLEWLNHGCPFVKKHYESHNMQNLQKQYTDKGVVWLSIVSSAPGKQGNMTPDETNKKKQEVGSAATAILLDEKGEVGKLYEAKTTPEMFVINPQGILVYAGAIDEKKSTDAADIPTSKNYVKAALDEAQAGKSVTHSLTPSYGCSVKY